MLANGWSGFGSFSGDTSDGMEFLDVATDVPEVFTELLGRGWVYDIYLQAPRYL